LTILNPFAVWFTSLQTLFSRISWWEKYRQNGWQNKVDTSTSNVWIAIQFAQRHNLTTYVFCLRRDTSSDALGPVPGGTRTWRSPSPQTQTCRSRPGCPCWCAASWGRRHTSDTDALTSVWLVSVMVRSGLLCDDCWMVSRFGRRDSVQLGPLSGPSKTLSEIVVSAWLQRRDR